MTNPTIAGYCGGRGWRGFVSSSGGGFPTIFCCGRRTFPGVRESRREVLEGLRELQRRSIPYDLLLRPQHLPVVPELVERVPDLPLVIDHIAKPLIATGIIEDWARHMEPVAGIPHIHVKLSGMITE